eukprot:6198103-Pleurochrysis_carterae.AAC.2
MPPLCSIDDVRKSAYGECGHLSLPRSFVVPFLGRELRVKQTFVPRLSRRLYHFSVRCTGTV